MTGTPPEWLIIETVNRLQRLARHEHNPTQTMITREVREKGGESYSWEAVGDVLERLGEEKVLWRSPGDYYSSVRWRIHPEYIPDESVGGDPYSPEHRACLRERAREEEQEAAKAREKAAERKREREREKRREEAEARRIEKLRDEARAGADPGKELAKLWESKSIEAPDVLRIAEEDPGAVLIIDTETTGLSGSSDDVLELSIINGAGRTVHTARYSSWLREWPEAQGIHGIAPEDVEGLPKLESDAAKVSGLLRRARVLAGYNIWFDIDFLAFAGIKFPAVCVYDVMETFAQVYGEWEDWIDEGRGGYKWQKLTTAGKYYGIDTRGAHGSLRDCQITLEVLRKLAKEPESKRHRMGPERAPGGIPRRGPKPRGCPPEEEKPGGPIACSFVGS